MPESLSPFTIGEARERVAQLHFMVERATTPATAGPGPFDRERFDNLGAWTDEAALLTAHIAVLESAGGEYDRDRSNVLSAGSELAYWRYRIARDAANIYVETTLDDGSLDDDDE